MEQWCGPHQHLQDQCWSSSSWGLPLCSGWPGWCLLPQHCGKVPKFFLKTKLKEKEKGAWEEVNEQIPWGFFFGENKISLSTPLCENVDIFVNLWCLFFCQVWSQRKQMDSSGFHEHQAPGSCSGCFRGLSLCSGRLWWNFSSQYRYAFCCPSLLSAFVMILFVVFKISRWQLNILVTG